MALPANDEALMAAINMFIAQWLDGYVREFSALPRKPEERSNLMPSKSFFIELKVNFNNDTQKTKDQMLRALAARTASVLLSNAMLLADRSDPRVTVIENDALDGPKDIDIRQFVVDDGKCPSCGHTLGEGE